MNAHAPNPTETTSETGALPSSLRFREPQWTGQFLHEAALKRTLFFKGEGAVPRSFTILVALASKPDRQANTDLTRNGIAIIDNDNWRIVADRCLPQPSGLKGASREQRHLFNELAAMDWTEFSSFCRSQSTYRAGSPDLDNRSAVPDCGDAQNQVQLGLRGADVIDDRTDFVRALHETGEYNLPKTSRDGMVKDLMMRQSHKVRDTRMLSWDVGMNYAWDRSGRVEGGEDLCSSFDTKWEHELGDNPEHLRMACDRAVAPYVASGFNVFELGEKAGCELNLGGVNDKFLMLSSFGELDMGFSNFGELREKLNGMNTEDLVNLWTTVRVLDTDLNRSNRAFDVAWELNGIRSSLEENWVLEADEEVHLAMA
ncbi:hypothetical protein KUV57_12505 [Epibacterium sp. DP7N7-1]|nr:hypothetical protein [Epibacterium sp. DP7N7-1]